MRVSAFGSLSRLSPEPGKVEIAAAPISARLVKLRGMPVALNVPVYARVDLGQDTRLLGPAIIEQLDATTMVLPGQVGRVDERLNLWLEEETTDG